MAAREDQLQALVRDRAVVEVWLVHGGGPSIGLQQPRLVLERPLSSYTVDRAVAPRGHQPGHRLLRQPVARPLVGRDRKRLLGSLLGQIHVTEEADQGSKDAAPLAPEDPLDQCAVSTGISTSGRTSTAPPSRTAGIRCATSSASSRLDASNTK